jgi:hypothetical protein
MKIKLYSLAFLLVSIVFASCSTSPETLDIEKLITHDAQYYENIKAFKKSNHEISYAYYENWSPVEGVSGYKDPASWGERMVGLPDSIDIVNLWMGVPSNDSIKSTTNTTGTTYAPVAYADMKYCQEKLGTRFVMHADASNYHHQFTVDGVSYDMTQSQDSAMMAAYAKYIMNTINEPGLDGVDIDYEGWSSSNLTRLVKELGRYIGPMGADTTKLLIVDFFSTNPPTACEPYLNYVVEQAYSNQRSIGQPGGYPSEKCVYCETFGVYYATGGQLLNYAKWEPSSGRKGGCGVFFLGRNYYSASGIPYNEFRKAIQIMNPAKTSSTNN